MTKLEKEIQKYYRNFKKDFNKKNFPTVYSLIDNFNSEVSNTHHPLGSFAILYTPVRYKPKLMMIGNNPSWFDKDDPAEGFKIVKNLMKSPPKVNSYITHNHVYGQRMQLIFNRVGRIDLLEKCVGMNRWWLQTGPENASWNQACRQKSFVNGPYGIKQNLYEYCEERTKEIINLIKPKVVILVGKKAQKLGYKKINSCSAIENVDYPLGRGVTLLEQQLREIAKTL